MRSIANVLGFLLLAGTLLAQTNPVPFVNQPLVPTTVAPGSAGFTLTINGTGFVSGSVVNWNGSARTTTFVSASELTAAILATDVLIASTASVTVSNPAPGGGVSNYALFPIAAARTSPTFSTLAVTTGTNPNAARVADLNGDGNSDIIAANYLSNTVGVLLGNGDGTFRPEVDYATGQRPFDVAIADFNGDGKLDLAVTNEPDSGNGSVSILLGNGDGTFQSHVNFATSYRPDAPFAVDLNRDGKLDLVVGIGGGFGGISVLLGNGDGTFQPHKEYTAPGGVTFGITVGDFNHDGILDVVTANAGTTSVSLLLGIGDGTFQPNVDFPAGTEPFSVTAADFNGDGNLDVAASNYTSNSVSILLGRGDGTFQPQVQYTVAGTPFGIISADVSGDGHLDLAVTDSFGLLSILLGNGDGTFQPNFDFNVGPAGQISAGDFNKDGLIDFATTNTGVTTVIQDQQGGSVVVLSASSVTFGTLLVGSVSLPQTVTLTNSGSSAITITTVSVGTVNFAVTNRCPTSVKPGQSCRLLLFFTPTASGSLTDTLTIYDTGGGSPQTVSLSGTGTVVTVSPASLNFGSVAVHKTSPPQAVTLTNRGSVRLTITKITVTGTNKNDFFEVNACGTSLVAGASCTISVYFTPLAKGTRNASLSITDTGGGSPQLVALTGSGQ